MDIRNEIINDLLGVDVYYPHPESKSQTNFCLCHASFFPFYVVLEYDDLENVV